MTYTLGYQSQDVTPLRQYFEVIFGQVRGMEAIGSRGDREYFWYSKDGRGLAFYDVDEQRLSADATTEWLSKPAGRKRYLSGIKAVSGQARSLCRKAERLESAGLAELSADELMDFVLSLWQLDAYLSSFYQISESYRMQQLDANSEFALEVQRLRTDMQTRGFEPLHRHMQRATDELARRFGYKDAATLEFLTHQEFEQFADADEAVVPLEELQRRRGDHDEYMVRINDGQIEYYFGDEAGKLFTQLVPTAA